MNKKNQSYLVNLKGIVNDILTSVIVFLLCFSFFNYGMHTPNISLVNTMVVACVYLLIYLFSGLSNQHYNLSSFYYFDRLIKRVSIGSIIATGSVVFIFYFLGRAQTNREFYAAYFIIIYFGLLTSAILTRKMNKKSNRDKNTLFIGSKRDYNRFFQYMEKTSFSYRIVGYLGFELEDSADSENAEYLGYVDQGHLDRIIRERVVDQVYIMNIREKSDTVRKYVDTCVKLGLETRLILPLEREDCYTHVGSIGNYPVVSYHMNNINPGMAFIKRVIDIVGSVTGILIFSPVLLLSAIAIKLDSKGPVFFTQTRIGKNGRHFKIFKLRTMSADAETLKTKLMAFNEMDGDGLMFKMKADPRITRVGAFLRKMSIDEIPQFFNVLIGDMSLVGTRPPTLDEVVKYENGHWRRLRIKPGITGLWQISGRNMINDFNEVVELDVQYIKNSSLLLDIQILLSTFAVVFRKSGAY